jgi:Tol biopolymer transport system component
MRCLAKRPADRWQTADDLLQQLELLATPSGGMTPVETRPVSATTLPAGPGARRWLVLLGVIVGVVVVSLVASRLGRVVGFGVRLGQRTAVTLEPGLEMTPAISPDGKMIAYSRITDRVRAIYVQQVGGGATVRVAEFGGPLPGMPSWSPDGTRLLYRSDRGLEIVPALGGVPRLVVQEPPRPQGPAQQLTWGTWAPDGARIAYVETDTLFVGVPGETDRRAIAAGGQLHSPTWSPNGEWIAYVSGNVQYVPFVNLAPSSIWVVRSSGGTPVRVTKDRPLHTSPVWLPSSWGRGLLFVSDQDGMPGSGPPNSATRTVAPPPTCCT